MLMTGLSGNEIYCLAQKGYSPGNIVVGNSVHSLGFVRGITSGLKTLSGGEIGSITQLIVDGRHAAIKRLEQEAKDEGDGGLTGVTSDLRKLGNLMEFIAIGSSVRSVTNSGPFFSTACTGQDLYCQIDAGYEPRHFVIGNVAYALGLGRGITGGLKILARRGEVKEFSDMYNHTRHLALERLEAEAAERGCNAVVDIITRILPFGPGVREMLMVGTGSFNPALGPAQDSVYFGADRRRALEPHPDGLRPAAPRARHKRLCPRPGGRSHDAFSVRLPGVRSTKSPVWSTMPAKTA